MQANIEDPEPVEKGETAVSPPNGKTARQQTAVCSSSFPLGIAQGDPLVPAGNNWLPMTDAEVEDWIEGR